MSDENQDYKNGLPSSDDLDTFIEEQKLVDAVADATVNEVNKGVCITCSNPSTRICTHCGQEFCATHVCISHELGTERIPIVDEDGTEHRGQRVKLIGEGWPNHLTLIKDLNDAELDARIADLQGLLTQAIRTQDYTQISLAAHEFERDYRSHSRYVAAVKRREKLQQGTVRLNNKKHRMDAAGKTIPPDIAAIMKLGNMSFEDAVKVKAMLGKAKP